MRKYTNITLKGSSAAALGLRSRKKLMGANSEAGVPSGCEGGQTILLSVFPEPGGCSTSPRDLRCHSFPSTELARHRRERTFGSTSAPTLLAKSALATQLRRVGASRDAEPLLREVRRWSVVLFG